MFSGCGVGVEPRTPQNLIRIGLLTHQGPLVSFLISSLDIFGLRKSSVNCWSGSRLISQRFFEAGVRSSRELARQQVSEAEKDLPLRGCTREPAIEAAIEHQIFPQVVVQGPQVADGTAPEKRLGEMPYLCGDAKVFHEGMRNRERLPELSVVNRVVDDFVKHIIGVIVKALYVRAGQKQD